MRPKLISSKKIYNHIQKQKLINDNIIKKSKNLKFNIFIYIFIFFIITIVSIKVYSVYFDKKEK